MHTTIKADSRLQEIKIIFHQENGPIDKTNLVIETFTQKTNASTNLQIRISSDVLHKIKTC